MRLVIAMSRYSCSGEYGNRHNNTRNQPGQGDRFGIAFLEEKTVRARKKDQEKQKKKSERAEPLEWVLLLSPYLIGLYYPWTSAMVSLVLLGILWQRQKEDARVSCSPLLWATGSLVLSLLLGVVWGTDRGMAVVGAVKFLPLPLYVLVLEQETLERRGRLLRKVPYSAAIMVLLSLLFSGISTLSRVFLINGRLSGFFQYPNSFAAWLLASLILCLNEMRGREFPKCRKEAAVALILMLGMILTGSRAVFVLMLTVLFRHILLLRNRKQQFLTLCVTLLFCLCPWLSALLFRDQAPERLLDISLYSSQLLGRLLYAQDAVPVILQHPLGLGYGGYQALQGSFQTGVYSVLHVHNDFLQLLLDAGWIPGLLFLWTLVRAFRREDGYAGRREMLFFLCLHALFDFDMQFVSLALLLVTCMSTELHEDKKVPALVLPLASVTAGMLVIWIGAASFLLWLGNAGSAAVVYPFYTEALTQCLASEDDPKAQRLLADRILQLNDDIALAHDAKAAAAFAEGDLPFAVEEKEKALMLSRYNREEYLDYLDLLQASYDTCRGRGERIGAAACKERIRALPQKIEEVLRGTSTLGWMIQDQPELDLPEEILHQIEIFGSS